MSRMKKFTLIAAWLFILLVPITGAFSTGTALASQIDGTVKDHLGTPDKQKAPAQDTPSQKESLDEANVDIGFGDVLKMVAALLFVILLLYALLKFVNNKARSYQQNRLIQNYGGTALGGNRSIQVVKVGGRILILGVGEDVTLLKEVTDEKELEEFSDQYDQQARQQLQPADVLAKGIKWWKGKNRAEDLGHADKTFQSHMKEQFEELAKKRKAAFGGHDRKEKESNE